MLDAWALRYQGADALMLLPQKLVRLRGSGSQCREGMYIVEQNVVVFVPRNACLCTSGGEAMQPASSVHVLECAARSLARRHT